MKTNVRCNFTCENNMLTNNYHCCSESCVKSYLLQKKNVKGKWFGISLVFYNKESITWVLGAVCKRFLLEC